MASEFKIKNGLYVEGLVTSPAASSVLTYNSTTKQVYYTASSAFGGGGSGTGNGFPYDGSTIPAFISGGLIISQSGAVNAFGLTVTGSVRATTGFTGSLQGTASFATTASYVTGSIFTGTNTARSASYALTASYLLSQGTPGVPGGAINSYQFNQDNLNFSGSNVLRWVSDTVGIVATGSFSGSLTGTATTASYISPTFISASAAASGFGSGGSSSTNTGSLLTTASVSLNTITFTKGDGSTFPITVSTGSGGGGGTGNGFPYTGSAILSGSLNMIATGSTVLLITGSIIQSQSLGNQVYGINIIPTMVYTSGSQTNTAFRVAPFFSGSSAFTSSQSNLIADFGAVNIGTQFSVNDITSGSIYTVNDISGLPIIEALSDWTVNMYNFPTRVFQKTGSAIIISASLTLSGALLIQSSSNTPVGSAVLVAGRALVSNTIVTANSTIFLTPQSGSGTQGFLSVGAKVAATSFAVSSSSTTDTSTFGYLIIN
jgi:hypothetical protein